MGIYKILSIFIIVVLLCSCANYVNRVESIPRLYVNNELYNPRSDNIFLVKFDDVELFVDPHNSKIVDTRSEILFLEYDNSGARKGYISSVPFIITLAMRSTSKSYFLDVSNAEFLIKGEKIKIYLDKIKKSISGENAGCMLSRGYANVPKVGNHVINIVLSRTDEVLPAWTCLKFVIDIPTPDPIERFTFVAGSLRSAKTNVEKILKIEFAGEKTKYKSTH